MRLRDAPIAGAYAEIFGGLLGVFELGAGAVGGVISAALSRQRASHPQCGHSLPDRKPQLQLLLQQGIVPAIVVDMKTLDVIEHYGSQYAAADALGIRQPSVANWGEFPPALRQLQLEALTVGKLKAEPDCDKYRVPAQAAA